MLSRHPIGMVYYIRRCYLLLRRGISEVLACKQVQRTPAPQIFRIDIVGLISKRTSEALLTLSKPLISQPLRARTNPSPPLISNARPGEDLDSLQPQPARPATHWSRRTLRCTTYQSRDIYTNTTRILPWEEIIYLLGLENKSIVLQFLQGNRSQTAWICCPHAIDALLPYSSLNA
jgi:hypothetical protein